MTRRSILDLARADPASVGVDVVSERAFTMPEVVAASKDGRLLEVFGAGTAAVVCPVREVVYQGFVHRRAHRRRRGPRRERALAAPLGRALRTGRVRLGRAPHKLLIITLREEEA